MDDLIPAVEAVAGGPSIPVAGFRYHLVGDTWAWSTGMFALHGFRPGEVVPTGELMMAHRHPDDRDRVSAAVTTALAAGEPFSCRYRINSADGRCRTVVVLASGDLGPGGAVIGLHGYFLDVTDPLRADVSERTTTALVSAVASRGSLERVKGALMLAYSLDAEEAFDLLRWHSQHANIKVRDLVQRLLDGLNDPELAALPPRRKIHTILVGMVGAVDVIPPELADPATAALPREPYPRDLQAHVDEIP
jgi:hypothetical protein